MTQIGAYLVVRLVSEPIKLVSQFMGSIDNRGNGFLCGLVVSPEMAIEQRFSQISLK